MTASIGVSAVVPGELDAKALLARADAAMYRAKRDGRNCVRVWEDYPEWRRTQARETPGPAVAHEPIAPVDQSDSIPDWNVLSEGGEGDVEAHPLPADDGDDWEEV